MDELFVKYMNATVTVNRVIDDMSAERRANEMAETRFRLELQTYRALVHIPEAHAHAPITEIFRAHSNLDYGMERSIWAQQGEMVSPWIIALDQQNFVADMYVPLALAISRALHGTAEANNQRQDLRAVLGNS